MKLLKDLLYSLDVLICGLIYELDRLDRNQNYLKLKSYYHAIIHIFRDTYLFHKSLFSNIGYYISFMYKIFKISLILTIIYRLALVLNIFLGFDIILAYHGINNDMLMEIMYNVYSNIIIYKNLCLQWLVDQLNSFITNDNIISEINVNIIEADVSPTDVKIESSSNINSLRADYKDTVISIEKESSFYNSAYFYIPVIIIVSIFGIYYCHEYFIDQGLVRLGLGGSGTITPPDPDSGLTSPSNFSDYFKSPELPLIDLNPSEGSPVASPETSPSSTPRAQQINLTEFYYPRYPDPFGDY
jgi:hypothetical protein